MELLARATKSLQAFWHEWRKGNTVPRRAAMWSISTCVTLARRNCWKRLPFIRELAKAYVGVDPVKESRFRRVQPRTAPWAGSKPTSSAKPGIKGLFRRRRSVPPSSSHGANRLGLTSLAELVVFGRIGGRTRGWSGRATAGEANGARAGCAGRRR